MPSRQEVYELQQKVEELEPLQQLVRSGEFSIFQQSSGPIPDPKTLKEYDALCPGFAKEFLNLFVAQSKNRMELEAKDQAKAHELFSLSARLPHIGLWIALVIVLLVLGIVAWAMYAKAYIVATTGLAGISAIIFACTFGRGSAKGQESEAEPSPDQD